MDKKKRGQYLVEFALVIALAAAAFMAMNIYAKRGIQAGVKRLADELGTQQAQGADPKRTTVSHTETTNEGSGDDNVQAAEGGSRDKASTSTGHTIGTSVTVSTVER